MNSVKLLVMSFVMDMVIIFVHVLMDLKKLHGIVDLYPENILVPSMHY